MSILYFKSYEWGIFAFCQNGVRGIGSTFLLGTTKTSKNSLHSGVQGTEHLSIKYNDP